MASDGSTTPAPYAVIGGSTAYTANAVIGEFTGFTPSMTIGSPDMAVARDAPNTVVQRGNDSILQGNFSDTSSTSVPDCFIAYSIVSKSSFQAAVAFECLFGGYAFVANVLLLAVGWRVLLFPANLRLLLGHLSVILAWFGLGGLVKGMYLLARPVCDHVITVRSCRLLDIMTTNMVMVAMLLALSAVCVERIWATARYRQYADVNAVQRPYIPILTILIIWGVTLYLNWKTYPETPVDVYTPICDTLVFIQWQKMLTYWISVISVETAAVIATVAIYYCNRYMQKHMVINRAVYDLSLRFQVDQNVQVNDVLLPSMILHLCCFLINYIFSMAVGELDPPTKATMIHVTFLWRQIYAGAHPTLTFLLNPRMKQELLRNIVGRLLIRIGGKCGHVEQEAMNVAMRAKLEETAHFRHLEQMWAMPKEKWAGDETMKRNVLILEPISKRVDETPV